MRRSVSARTELTLEAFALSAAYLYARLREMDGTPVQLMLSALRTSLGCLSPRVVVFWKLKSKNDLLILKPRYCWFLEAKKALYSALFGVLTTPTAVREYYHV
ncbi:hypothetical protein BDW69DRAFT_64427 [Aspergillus filifer]